MNMHNAVIAPRVSYLQKDGFSFTVMPSDVTGWVTKARNRKLGRENRRGHFEGDFSLERARVEQGKTRLKRENKKYQEA